MNPRPIGVFDSGMGGLTAVRRLRRLMPSENIIYFGDTARVPYGNRSRETLLQYARQDLRFLESFDLKAVLVACGTISANCLEDLRPDSGIPVIGVVEPAVKRAAAETKTGKIGMVATRASVSSGAYERALARTAPGLEMRSLACPLFVPLVEEGRFRPGDVVIETIAREYLAPLREPAVDTLILGCTHYPLLRDVIGGVMGPSVRLIDVGGEAAVACRNLLAEGDALANRETGSIRCYTSDHAANFERLASLFLGEDLRGKVEHVDIAQY